MESLTRSFSTTSVDVNKVWRRRIYDVGVGGSPDGRNVKTARFGESHHGRFSKLKKMFNLGGGSQEHEGAAVVESPKKSKPKSHRSSNIAGSRDEFESRLMSEIYKNMSSSHELSSSQT